MTVQPTRKLTGIPAWPIVLLAGGEKAGKTWAAVQACMSPLVAGGLWFPLGEDDPDDYANIPGFDGARFDLQPHDGSYRGLLEALDHQLKLEKQRKPGTEPLCWVLDSGTRLWDLLSGMAQREMWERLARKAAQQNRPAPDVEQKPAVDLWNTAADRWEHIFNCFRDHQGPSIITARMELTTLMDSSGNPTKDKAQKIQAQKRLPFDVSAIVEMPVLGETYLTGVRSVRLSGLDPRVALPRFTVDELWRRMGLDESSGLRTHSAIDPDDKPAAQAEVARTELRELCTERGWAPAAVAALWAETADAALKDSANAAAIRAFMAELDANGLPGQEKAA